MSLCGGVQLCVWCGRGAEEGVIVETFKRLQRQSESSASFGGSVWSLSQLQNDLDSDDEQKSLCLHIEHVFNNLTTKVTTSPTFISYLHRLALQQSEVESCSMEEGLPFEAIEGPQATGGGLAQKLDRQNG